MILAATKSTPLIDWASLGKVAFTSAAFGIGVVTVFSLGIYALTMLSARAEPVTNIRVLPAGNGPTGNWLAMALAGACFALCAAAVIFGLWLIIPAFH